MANGNPILQALLEGQQPDPMAAFFANAVLSGKAPGDPVSNFQTALSLLATIPERRAAEPGLTDLLGLGEGEEGQLTRQLTGLVTTPAQELVGKTAMQQAMMDFLESQETLGVRKGELDVKRAKETREREAAPTEKAYREALAAQANALAAQRNADREMRTLLRAGVDEQGSPLTQQQTSIMERMLGLRTTHPQEFLLYRDMLESGIPEDRAFAAQQLSGLLGVDTSTIADPATWYGSLLNSFKAHLGPSQLPAPAETGVAGGFTEEQQRQLDERQKYLEDLAKRLQEEE
jgi:hypothetical protein